MAREKQTTIEISELVQNLMANLDSSSHDLEGMTPLSTTFYFNIPAY
jgi:hypothetical protein